MLWLLRQADACRRGITRHPRFVEISGATIAEDIYAMSCMTTVIDHPGERAYMNNLAAALCIPPERRDAIERDAAETRARMSAQAQAPAPDSTPAMAPEPAQAEASAPAENAKPATPKQEPSEQAAGTGNGV